MRWITNLAFRLRALLAPRRMERELDDELAFHLEREAEKLTRQGMTPEAARHQAQYSFGQAVRGRERVREAWGIGLAHDLEADVRYALRGLRKNPVFAGVAIFTLALGIGGTTAIFGVLDAVVLQPLPLREPGRLVAVHHTMPGIGVDETPLSPALYRTFREHSRTLEDIGVWQRRSVTVTGLARPEQVEAAFVTDGLLPVLGVSLVLGREFEAADAAEGSANTVLLSEGYWLRALG
ncbi:MAG: permease prefix domain 1-containing protein, partial [Gemmatimonadales bacterium]